jgi:hypothetical protein
MMTKETNDGGQLDVQGAATFAVYNKKAHLRCVDGLCTQSGNRTRTTFKVTGF